MRISSRDYYLHGSANVWCDRCGFKYKLHELRREWTGLRVCDGPGTNGCFETRHPQDFVKGKPDKQSFPDPRPEGPDRFIEIGDVVAGDL